MRQLISKCHVPIETGDSELEHWVPTELLSHVIGLVPCRQPAATVEANGAVAMDEGADGAAGHATKPALDCEMLLRRGREIFDSMQSQREWPPPP